MRKHQYCILTHFHVLLHTHLPALSGKLQYMRKVREGMISFDFRAESDQTIQLKSRSQRMELHHREKTVEIVVNTVVFIKESECP